MVSAVPWFALETLFARYGEPPPALAATIAAARAMAASPIVTVNLWFDRPVLDQPFVGLPGRAMQWVFDKRTVLWRLGVAPVARVERRRRDLRADQCRADRARPATNCATPCRRRRRPTLVRATVIREPRATFSLARRAAGAAPTRTDVRGLFLAGDWIATGLPATIESAVRSGHRAADAAATS